jgi:hypothetical protein
MPTLQARLGKIAFTAKISNPQEIWTDHSLTLPEIIHFFPVSTNIAATCLSVQKRTHQSGTFFLMLIIMRR